jgi:hypothetical protein
VGLGGLEVAKTVLFAEGSGFDSQTQLKAMFSRYFNQVSLQLNINSSLIYTNLHQLSEALLPLHVERHIYAPSAGMPR